MNSAGRRHPRDDRRVLPTYRDTTSEVISLYGLNRDNSGCGSSARSLDDVGFRSYSLTSCGSRVLSDQKSTGTSESRSSGGDVRVMARPRSPYPYHTRLKRPGVRPISPALTSDGIVDYSRMVEIDRPSYRTIHRSYSRAYPSEFHHKPHPRSHSGDGRSFQYLSSGNSGHQVHRSGHALTELPPAWVNHGRNRSLIAPGDRADETSSISSIVRLYGHSRASSVTRLSVPRLGSFYYDYGEDFEPAVGRTITACVTVSPTPTRSSMMNRPMVLDNSCEPLLATGMDLGNPIPPLLHADSSSLAPAPARASLDSSVPLASLDCKSIETKDVRENSLALVPVPVDHDTVTSDSVASTTTYQKLDSTSAVTSGPILVTYTAEDIVIGASTHQGSLTQLTNASQMDQADDALVLSKPDPETERSWSTILSEGQGDNTVTEVDLDKADDKPLTRVVDSNEHTSVVEPTQNDTSTNIVATADSNNVPDISFCSTVDNSENDTRHSDPATTPGASEPTNGAYVAELGDYSEEASKAIIPMAQRQSDLYSLQSGLSDLKSFVHKLDNAGLLRDGDDLTKTENDIKSANLVGHFDRATTVHAMRRTSNRGLEKDDLDIYPSRHSRLVVTDLTFDSRHSVDGSSLVYSSAKIKALPLLPNIAYSNGNRRLKLTSSANLRVPQRLSSFHGSAGGGQPPDTCKTDSLFPESRNPAGKPPRILHNTLIQQGNNGATDPSQDTSITYGISGLCVGRQPLKRAIGSTLPVKAPDSSYHPTHVHELSAALVSISNQGRATKGFNGRSKGNTVRLPSTARLSATAKSLQRRASGHESASRNKEEAPVLNKPLPSPPGNAHGGPATQPRGLKKSLSNLRMRLTDVRAQSGETSSSDSRLQRRDEKIGLGVPVTLHGTSSNTFSSGSTEEDIMHAGFRQKFARWMKSAKKAVHSCRRFSSSTGETSLNTDP